MNGSELCGNPTQIQQRRCCTTRFPGLYCFRRKGMQCNFYQEVPKWIGVTA